MQGATADEVKAAYRKLAMKHHPDRGGDPNEFVKIKEAFETLEKSNFLDNDSIRIDELDINAYADFFRWEKFTGFGTVNKFFIKIDIKDAFKGTTVLANALKGTTVLANARDASISVRVPAGISTDEIVHDADINGVRHQIYAKITCDHKISWDQGHRGDIEMDFYVSPLIMILGGWADVQLFDGSTVSVRIPAGLEANKLLKIKDKGYWKSTKCQARGNCFLKIIPKIQKLDEISKEELKEFISAAKTHHGI